MWTYVEFVWEERHVDEGDGAGRERDVVFGDVVGDGGVAGVLRGVVGGSWRWR